MVELTVPYESRMEEAHAFKEEKYLDMTKELKKDGYEAKVMSVEIGARGFVGSSAYGLLSKLSISGNKRTKGLRVLAETAENILAGYGAEGMKGCFIRIKIQLAEVVRLWTCNQMYAGSNPWQATQEGKKSW
ncbi:reverse transcriptase [Plakobranchus ocellatus]|uniref:Reverse transcriptase n=1 Tax=Plakobranchus ocellatus TaxID=259542 RepID=A0AAV4DSD1_9GAST|nr:reverse transcriptase [Plakobranchus ocellatus]